MEYIEPGSGQYGRAISALFLGSFVTFAALYSTQPLIPAISREFNVTPAVGSLSLSLATGALAVFMLVAPAISDLTGRKPVMTASLLFSAVLSIFTAFTRSFTMLLLTRLLQGVFLAGFPAIAMGYINEEIDPRSTGLVMGIYVSGTSFGGMAGRIITGALTDLFTWHTALGILGAINLLVSFFFWRMLPESRHFSPRKNTVQTTFFALFKNLRTPGLLPLYCLGFILMGAFVTLYNYIGYPLMAPPYNLSQTVAGLIFLVYLTGTFSSAWMGGLADRTNRAKVLKAGIAIMFSGALLTLDSVLIIKIIGIAIFTFGFFGSHSVASGWVGKRAGTDSKAQASSLYLLFYYAGSSLVGTTGGLFWSRCGWAGVVSLIGFLLFTAFCLSLLVHVVKVNAKRVT
ncbi:MFS transporter [Desulfotomaculum copahuensis]|uniref:Major facilitator superfamily (MFS) profile domain-containing protein n=1 Tax=Desulfotomaculum copahuensis TaxID=1838280 RepID=A0A1B7LIM5_9FIRM|nr:MFS transporter [Desulfotomaculum copahuensis]OAT86425.1 hypothetical protein A6M21_03080 [Desulfotomaculum copahuensis]